MTIIAEPQSGVAVEDLSPRQWQQIEDAFRVHAFRVFHRQIGREEHCPLKRFVKALLDSAGPIQDRQAVVDWYRSDPRRPWPE